VRALDAAAPFVRKQRIDSPIPSNALFENLTGSECAVLSLSQPNPTLMLLHLLRRFIERLCSCVASVKMMLQQYWTC
jgi:hypothetical protein